MATDQKKEEEIKLKDEVTNDDDDDDAGHPSITEDVKEKNNDDKSGVVDDDVPIVAAEAEVYTSERIREDAADFNKGDSVATTTATATATVVAEVGSKEAAEDNDKDKKDGQDEEKDNPEEEKSNKGDNDQHEHHEPDSDVMNATRVLCGFICEVIVLVSLACGVIFNSLLLVVCDLLTINTAIDGVIVVGGEVKIEGYLGLYRADILAILEDLKDNSTTTMTTNSTDVVDNNMGDTQPRDAFFGCVYIDSIPGLEEDGVIDVAFNCARFCAVIGFAFGALLLFFVLFQQYSPYCGVPQSSQILMWSCGLVIQIFLALVYVIPYTWICDDNYCEYGIGLVWLVCAEFSWFIATIFTRCMRPGVRERRNRKAAAAAGEH
mmetsp:Transcript_31552/g.32032  ORF Transcript_31552/g.32032 Transcript_31552/m.32032 type:complete len:378 (+) Transcript_31552:32-1165(+)